MTKVNLIPLKGRNSSDRGTAELCVQEQIEVKQCLLSFGAECFVLQFVVQKYKGILNCNFACFVLV